MAKGKKVTPKVAKFNGDFKFDKGFSFTEGGYFQLPDGAFQEWDLDKLKQVIEWHNPEPQAPASPVKEFTDDWYEKNKDSL